MRLPWLSRRSAGHATRGAAAAPAAARDATQSNALPVGRSEWRDVGALRPSFGADPGVRVQDFREGLAGSQLPDPILRPLGHQRSADGPAGLVSGLTRPVIARVVAGPGSAQSLPLARRLRSADVVDGAGSPDIESPADLASPGLPTVPLRQVPVVTDDRVVARSMTSAGPADRRLVPGQAARSLQRSEAAPGRAPTPGPGAPVVVGQTTGTIVGSSPVVARTILRSSGRSRVRLGPPINADMATRATTPEPAGGADTGTAAATAPQTHVAAPPVADAPLTGGLQPSIAATPQATHSASSAPAADASDGTWTAPSGLVLARTVATAESAAAQHGPSASRSSDAPAPTPVVAVPGTSIGATPPDAPLVGNDPLTRTTWPQGDPMATQRTLEATGSVAALEVRGPTPSVGGAGPAAVGATRGAVPTSAGVAVQRTAVAAGPTTGTGPMTPKQITSSSQATVMREVDSHGTIARAPSTRSMAHGAAVAVVAAPVGRAIQRSAMATTSTGVAQGSSSAGTGPSGNAPGAPATLVLARQDSRPSEASRTSDATTASGATPDARSHTESVVAHIQRDGDIPAAAPAAGNRPASPSGTVTPTPGRSGAASGAPGSVEESMRLLKLEQDMQRTMQNLQMLTNIMKLSRERSGQIAANLRG